MQHAASYLISNVLIYHVHVYPEFWCLGPIMSASLFFVHHFCHRSIFTWKIITVQCVWFEIWFKSNWTENRNQDQIFSCIRATKRGEGNLRVSEWWGDEDCVHWQEARRVVGRRKIDKYCILYLFAFNNSCQRQIRPREVGRGKCKTANIKFWQFSIFTKFDITSFWKFQSCETFCQLETLMGRYRPEAYLVVMAVDDKATLDQAERTLAYLRCAAYHLTRHVSEVWQCSEAATIAFINVSMKTQIMTKREDVVVVWVLLSLNIYLPLILFQTEGSHSGSFRTSSNIADMSAAGVTKSRVTA